MRFKLFHNDFFAAVSGSYSKVTEREYYDSQITLTDYEYDLVTSYFGLENIHVGNVRSNPMAARKTFYLYPDLEQVYLNLIFPKPNKTELRLYISSMAGFKPLANRIWFLYEANRKLIIGSMTEGEWHELGQEDHDDNSYQAEILSTLRKGVNINIDSRGQIRKVERRGSLAFYRDPRIAAMRLDMANYTCEFNADHSTFISESTGNPYVEAHHFIPMRAQHLFSQEALDNVINIIALCPNCHRRIHHAVVEEKKPLIEDLYYKRSELHHHSLEEILGFYNSIRAD